MESSTVHEPLPEPVQALADDTVSAIEVKAALFASVRDSLETQWAQLTLPRRPG
jgi:hypothetical protein